jgi:beta-aspartyl-peptidase (threonine type)
MRARSLLIEVLLLSLFTLSASAQNSHPDVKSQVIQVLEFQQASWNRHDLEGFMAGYWNSPELTFFSGAKVNSGWQSTLNHYRKTYQSEGREMGKLEFSDLNVQELSPDAAFVRGAWKLTISDTKGGEKNPHGLFTLVFRKFPEGWKIIHDHTSIAE